MARLLRTDLPDEVWDALNAEAAAHGEKIGHYVRSLIVARHERRVSRNGEPGREARMPTTGATDSTNPTDRK